ncbi:MAG: fasciclin domain-containing protein, partial [Bacteroidota bacterium]
MKEIKILWKCLFLFGIVSFFVACDDDEATPEPQNLVEIAAADGQFSILVAALQRVGLDTVLAGNGPFTVFAPTNSAFNGINVDDLDDDELTNILLYHVFIGQSITSGAIQEGNTYISTASQGGPGNTNLSALINKTGTSVKINGSINVTTADVTGTNGVIHIIDGVMMPMDVVGHAIANTDFSLLVGALQDASGDLVAELQKAGPFTVFAPVNSAFEAISDVVADLSEDALSGVLL